MGAQPRWISLALTLPKADDVWLAGFTQGFHALAVKHNVALIGGDTTRGPLSITISAKGTVPAAQALRRSGAKAEMPFTSVAARCGSIGRAAAYTQFTHKQ